MKSETKELTGYPSMEQSWLKHFGKGAESEVYKEENRTLFRYVYDKNKEYLDEYALRYFERRITYGELFENIENCAKALLKYGIKKGDYVTLCLPNVPEMVYFFYALCRIGAIANMIDPRMNSKGIVDKVVLSDSKLLITVIDICREKIDEIADKLPVEYIVVVSPSDSIGQAFLFSKETVVNFLYAGKKNKVKRASKKYILLGDFLEKYHSNDIHIKDIYEPNMPVCVTYTSGTTGVPKGAQFSNESIIAQNKNMHYGADTFRRRDTFLGIMPMFSAYGIICGLNVALCSGWETILLPRFNPLKFDELIAKYKPNNSLGVPRFWETLIDSKVIDRVDLSFINIALSGGDKVSTAVLERVNRKLHERGAKCRLKVGYGSTELGGAIATMLDEKCYEPGSVGTILPGTKVKIINPDTGIELPYNEAGEICAASPTQMINYLKNPEETENIVFIDEEGNKYYRTGDKGYLTQEGILYIVDRYKRLMKRPDGHQVHASLIENTLSMNKEVKAVAVVGILQNGRESGVIPVAFVIKSNVDSNNDELAIALDEYCKERIAHRDIPLAYVFVDSIPYTPMGKVDFKKLEQNTFETISAVIVDRTFFD